MPVAGSCGIGIIMLIVVRKITTQKCESFSGVQPDMTQPQSPQWEKPTRSESLQMSKGRGERLKFLIGGMLILGAVVYLIAAGTLSGAQYFMTVDDLVNNVAEYDEKSVRISGAVVGDTIDYDSEDLTLEFTIANIPTEFTNLADTLEAAVVDPSAARVHVRIENEVKPDLLRHRAQAIVTGRLGEDGVFHADELLLKCPSRFLEDGPQHEDLVLQEEV